MNLLNIPSIWPEEERFLYLIPDDLNPYNTEEYGARIHERRTALGYSLQVVGEEVGCSYENVRKIEQGKPRRINKDLTPLFAKKLDCSCSYLLGYTLKPTGIWSKPDESLYMPAISYRPDEIIANTAMIAGYNRDPNLYIQCLRALREPSLEKRKSYMKVLKEKLDQLGSK